MATSDIVIFRGNNRTIEVTVTDSDGAAYSLVGAVLSFDVKRNETDDTAVITKTSADPAEIQIVAPASGGIFEIYLLPADSATIEGNYVYDITMVIGGQTYTLVKAKIDFNMPVK